MEYTDGILKISAFLALTLGIIVLFVGKRINNVVAFLREYCIPEPVTGKVRIDGLAQQTRSLENLGDRLL